ncbi:hypothetical protein C4571_00735 [Candidatus Parcubacteria bacterium]|nr:MAG: hypothetical protein C4571_00735 [Candidatus Parcubacteria bacterium]
MMSPGRQRNRLLLIDANSLIHRAFHALPPLTTPGGSPVQAIYGVASILIKVWKEGKPDYAAALFDRPEPTFRKQKYEPYKAHRPPAPPGLVEQIVEAHRLFPSLGIRVLESPGSEADDLIATLATRFAKEPDLQVEILSGDLDTLQLVRDDDVVVRVLKKGVSETELYNEDGVATRFGLKPSQLTDYKALVGDPSDNVPGVPGIGPKTARGFLQKFDSLERLFENTEENPVLLKKLAPFRKEADLSKSLVVLDRNVPIPELGLGDLRTHDLGEDFFAYCERQGFGTLLRRAKADGSSPRLGKQQAIF